MYRTLWFLVETAGSLLAGVCLLRALAWRARLSPHDPLHRFAIAATDWLVKPLRKVLPASRTNDWASIVAALAVALVLAVVWSLLFSHGRAPMFGSILLLAVFWVLKWSIYLVIGLVLIQALMSWVNPHAPLAPVVDQLTRPFLAPLRRIVPLVGGVDLSPLVLIVLAQVLLTLLETGFVSLVAIP